MGYSNGLICVYKIRNVQNNEIYIGSTLNFRKRKNTHHRNLDRNQHHSVYLQRAYNKYGKDSFVFELLEVCLREELFSKEEYWINALRPKYNVGGVGGGDNYSKHPDKENIKKKLIAGLTKVERKPRPKETNSNWKGGKTFFTCPVCCKEIRIAGDKVRPKTCYRCRDRNGEKNPFFGKTHSEETKEKLRQVAKARWSDPDYIENQRIKQTGLKRSPEHVEKVRRSRISRKHSEETKEKIRQANKGKKRTPAQVERIRQGQLNRVK